MQMFNLLTAESAPEKCKAALRTMEARFGFLPNVLGIMANNPNLLNGFVGTFNSFHGGSFDKIERQVLLLTNAVTIKCPWTVAVHTKFATEDGVAESDINAIREGKLPKDPKYAALSSLTKALIEKKGNVTDADTERFTTVGYSKNQLLEVVAGIGLSTMTAITTNMTGTPLEERLLPYVWSPAAAA